MATPPDAAAVAVLEPPSNVPLLSVRVTVEVSVLTRLLYASSTFTVTAGLMAAPAVASVGCWPRTTLVAVAGLIEKLLLAPEGFSDPSVADSV